MMSRLRNYCSCTCYISRDKQCSRNHRKDVTGRIKESVIVSSMGNIACSNIYIYVHLAMLQYTLWKTWSNNVTYILKKR